MKKEAFIMFFGQRAKIACDGNCKKAWGSNSRPTKKLSADVNDYCFLSDNELGEAPIDPGTYEGGQGKPHSSDEFPNKWCARECERCVMSEPGKFNLPIKLEDFSKRVYNLARS